MRYNAISSKIIKQISNTSAPYKNGKKDAGKNFIEMKKILSIIAVFTLFFGLCNNAYSYAEVTSNNDECVVQGYQIIVKPYKSNQKGRTLKLHIVNTHVEKDMTMEWEESGNNKSTVIKANGEKDVTINYDITPLTLTYKVGDYTGTYTFVCNQDDYEPELNIQYVVGKGPNVILRYQAKDTESQNYSMAAGKSQIKSATAKLSNGQTQKSNDDDAVITFSNLTPNTTYTVTVSVTDYAGNTKTSNPQSVTTGPLTPSGLKVTPSYETATLSWNAVSGAVCYYIYKNNETKPMITVTGTSYTIQGLSIGTIYNDKYYVVAENSAGVKSENSNKSGSFTTKGFEITGPDLLCAKASYAIKDYNSSLFSVSKWSCSTSTVKATNGNGYSIELKKVADGEGWISFTLKSKSTQKEYTVQKSFVVGTPYPGLIYPTNVYTGVRNVISTSNNNYQYSNYNWNIDMTRIVYGQGTSKITFIVDAQTPAPRDYVTMANDEVTNDNTNNYRSTMVRAKPLPKSDEVRGRLTVTNTCGSATYRFSIIFKTDFKKYPIPLTLADSLDVQLFGGDIPLAIESKSASYDESFVIYPNPTSSVINIRQPYDKESIKTIDIFDATGKKCISEVFGNNDSFATVDISALPNGTYILIVNQNENAQAGTFIKQ